MDKKFPEYDHLDLSAVNKEMLKEWEDKDIFRKSLETRERPSNGSSFTRDRHRLTECPAFITLSLVR